MLAITTKDHLLLIDPKQVQSSVSPTIELASQITAQAWAPDNSSLFLASKTDISQYTPTGEFLKTVYNSSVVNPMNTLISKDRGSTLIFSQGHNVHVLETHSGKISQTFSSQKDPVTALALSNDNTLLASTSANAIQVHNLSMASHTALRGVPTGGVTACAFHPHSRTRLLLGIGMQLVIYDTTKPSGPVKMIPLDREKSNAGEIVAVACSPFSKTLLAVACSGGIVGLVDLDKEKGLFRTLTLRAPITSLVFSPEGAALYAGTENGKLLVMDLRALQKSPRAISVSETGERIIALCIQKKLKSGEVPAKTTAVAPSKPLAQHDANKNLTHAQVQARRAVLPVSKARITPASPAHIRRVVSNTATTTPTKARTPSTSASRRALAPSVRSPIERTASTTRASALGRASATRESVSTARKVFSPPKSPLARSSRSELTALDLSVRMETLVGLPQGRKENVDPAGAPRIALDPSASQPSVRDSVRTRKPPLSGAHSTSSTKSRIRSVSGSTQRSGPTTTQDLCSRTPSPSLPSPDKELMTPTVTRQKGKAREIGMNVLGLGTPEVQRWVEAGEVKHTAGRKVGFAADEYRQTDDSKNDNARDTEVAEDAGMTMQISPRRTLPESTSWAPVPSPLRNTGTSPAHDLLHTVISDALFDFRRETKEDIVGLHLDLVRMGRGWRREMRDAMDEWRAELRTLKDENKLLREENERLKRGY